MKKSNPIFSINKFKEAAELPFFIFLTVILGGISIWTVIVSPALHVPIRLIPFTILMLVHIALYWLGPFVSKNIRRVLGYLFIQGILAFTLNLIGHYLGLVFSLYLGLIGMSAGLLKLTRWTVIVVGFYMALSLISYGLSEGWNHTTWWMIAIIPMVSFVMIYVILYNRQAEARDRAQALLRELESANRQLADYAARVEELTLVNERQRMARELHDTLSQGLAGLVLKLEAADAHLANNRIDRARAIIQQTIEQARTTLSDARRAIDDLRQGKPEKEPAHGDKEDLAAAVNREIEHFSDSTSIPCQLEIDLPTTIPGALFEPATRTISEALTNIARHARASQVQLRLSETNTWLEVMIHDNGIGFNPETAAGQAGHYGLLGMQERARLAGGAVKIISNPGEGTTIHLRFPMTPQPSGTLQVDFAGDKDE